MFDNQHTSPNSLLPRIQQTKHYNHSSICSWKKKREDSTSLIPRPMIVVFGLGTRLHVCMHTKLENGVLRNRQQPQRVVNGFIDQGEFEAMKTLSDRRAPR